MPTFLLFQGGDKKGELVGAAPQKLKASYSVYLACLRRLSPRQDLVTQAVSLV